MNCCVFWLHPDETSFTKFETQSLTQGGDDSAKFQTEVISWHRLDVSVPGTPRTPSRPGTDTPKLRQGTSASPYNSNQVLYGTAKVLERGVISRDQRLPFTSDTATSIGDIRGYSGSSNIGGIANYITR